MFSLARALAIAGIRAAEPGLDAATPRARLFERFYGDDFNRPSARASSSRSAKIREGFG